MLKSFIKIAWRNLRKNKLYTFVNILGLTIGITSCILIGLYVTHELSYDRFNDKADQIARITAPWLTMTNSSLAQRLRSASNSGITRCRTSS